MTTQTTNFGSERSLRIAHQDGEERRSVHVDLTNAGSLDVSGFDRGPSVERTWGNSDYEFGIEIAAGDLPRLAFALVVEHYTGDLAAVQKIGELANRHGIKAEAWRF